MYFYFCDENVSVPALYFQFCELRKELRNKFTFKAIQRAGTRQIDEGYEFETSLKRNLYEFWGSDPTRFVYRYD